jgi:mercuric ion binding protein
MTPEMAVIERSGATKQSQRRFDNGTHRFGSNHWLKGNYRVTKFVEAAFFGLSLFASSTVLAGEKTVTLTVQNMYCSACPITVKSSLEAVPGVAKAVVSYADKTAVVTFDDAKTAVPILINAATKAGYPSALKS